MQRIRRVLVMNENEDSISMWPGRQSDGIILRDIDGLGPVKSAIVTTKLAQIAGTRYQTQRRESRNIVLHMGLDSRYTGEETHDLRERLNNILMPGQTIRVIFYLGDTEEVHSVRLDGVVETNEPDIFANRPTISASIMCFDPDFLELTDTVMGGEAHDTWNFYQVDYEGSVPTGMVFNFFVNNNDSSTGFTFRHRDPLGNFQNLVFNTQLQGGDNISVSTVPGHKHAILIRGGVQKSVLHAVTPTSGWPQLTKGRNLIAARVSTEQTYYELRYRVRYGSL